MSHRYITGNLASDPTARQAGQVQIVSFTVLENTAHYQGNTRIPGRAPINHFIEAKFELGENVLASFHKGDAVVVIGHERDNSFDGEDGALKYRRVIDAAHVGADVAHATVTITRNAPRQRDEENGAGDTPPPPPLPPTGSMWEEAGA